MEARAHIKHIRISPIKLRFLIKAIKGMSPKKALDSLVLSQKRSSKVLYKAIKSAVDNARVKQMNVDMLQFHTLAVDEGAFLKRFKAGSRGMARPFKRRASHVLVILEEKKKSPVSMPVVKKQQVEAVATKEAGNEVVVEKKDAKVAKKTTVKKSTKTLKVAEKKS